MGLLYYINTDFWGFSKSSWMMWKNNRRQDGERFHCSQTVLSCIELGRGGLRVSIHSDNTTITEHWFLGLFYIYLDYVSYLGNCTFHHEFFFSLKKKNPGGHILFCPLLPVYCEDFGQNGMAYFQGRFIIQSSKWSRILLPLWLYAS